MGLWNGAWQSGIMRNVCLPQNSNCRIQRFIKELGFQKRQLTLNPEIWNMSLAGDKRELAAEPSEARVSEAKATDQLLNSDEQDHDHDEGDIGLSQSVSSLKKMSGAGYDVVVDVDEEVSFRHLPNTFRYPTTSKTHGDAPNCEQRPLEEFD